MKSPRIFYRTKIIVTRSLEGDEPIVITSGVTNHWKNRYGQYYSWLSPSRADNVSMLIDSLKLRKNFNSLERLNGKLYFTLVDNVDYI